MTAKILIVDDDIDTLQLVGTMLERQGYEILAANNGVKAVEVAQQDLPDLILLDVMMPGMDGYEVTRRLRNLENTAFIPIILFTAKAQVEDKVEGFEAGADDYLTKPTHPAELIARVKTIINRPRTGSLDEADIVQPTKMGRVFGVLSAKGGLGVSTVALNLGTSIHARTEQYVIVADLRPGYGEIGLYLGYKQSEGLNALLSRAPEDISLSDVEDELVAHGSGILLLLASFRPTDAEFMDAVEQYDAIVGHLSRLAPYTVLDLGAGLPPATKQMVKKCDQLIVLVEPSRHSITQTRALLQNLEDLGIAGENIKVVLNNRIRLEISLPASEVSEKLGVTLAGILTPAPELAFQAAARNVAMITQQPDSLTAQQINKLADLLTDPAAAEVAE